MKINTNIEDIMTEEESKELLGQALSNELWRWLVKMWPINTWKNTCWRSVKKILKKFWIKWTMSWNWYQWEEILNNLPNQFLKVKVSHPNKVKPWWILVYGKGAEKWSQARSLYGHVEIKWADNLYYSYYASKNPGWSARTSENVSEEKYKKLTWFIWYAYYPIKRGA